MQVHRDIMDGRYVGHAAKARRLPRAGARWVSPRRASKRARSSKGPCFIDEGAVVKAARGSAPTASSAAVPHRGARESRHAIVWANSRISQEAIVRRSILGRHCHIGRSAIVDDGVVLGDKSVSRTTAGSDA
jgi:NDP-sugar pyrophosphorylase family protein